MTDFNWDLAPKGTETLRQVEKFGYLRWFNSEGQVWDGSKWFKTDEKYHTIATRPKQTFAESITKMPQPTQTKTVADAVEWAESGWLYNDCDVIIFSAKYGKHGLVYSKSERPLECTEYQVCTRAEFEAYVKEQGDFVSNEEQEGEKWTHYYYRENARILVNEPDCDGFLVGLTEHNGYQLIKPDELKPIKPRITKAKAWDKIYDAIHDCGDAEFSFNSIVEQYDIT